MMRFAAIGWLAMKAIGPPRASSAVFGVVVARSMENTVIGPRVAAQRLGGQRLSVAGGGGVDGAVATAHATLEHVNAQSPTGGEWSW